MFLEKDFLESVFESFEEGIFILDANGKANYANSSALQFLGERMDSLKKKSIHSLIQGNWAAVIESQTVAVRDIEFSAPTKKLVTAHIRPIKQGTKRVGTLIIMREANVLKKQERSSEEEENLNALILLSAGLAHEIGNPLNSLNIHLQLMRREIQNSDGSGKKRAIEENLCIAEREIQRLDEIVQKFLSAVRPSSLKKEIISLKETIKETCKMLESEMKKKSIKLQIRIPKEMPFLIEADKGKIQQILINLLKNSYESIQKKGNISIELTDRKYEIMICIKDDGEGIKPENLAKIFQPYCSFKKNGNGLGLFLVKKLIQEHGGKISIEGIPQEGTDVTIYLQKTNKKPRLMAKEVKR